MWRALSATLLLWSFLAGTAAADSFTITDVVVTVGYNQFDAQYVGWSLPVTLAGGQSLVLAQNYQGPINADAYCSTCSYNFDLSEYAGTPLVQFVVNGVVHAFMDYEHVLTGRGKEGGNEATEFELLYKTAQFEVWGGYADNVHPMPCEAPRCFPTNFFSPTFLQTKPAYLYPGVDPILPFHCPYGAPCAWDSAAMLFVNTDAGEPPPCEHNCDRSVDPSPVPESSSLVLMALGLFGLVHVVRKRS